jgi:hypothetical protein
MTAFNLEDSASHNLTAQEIVIRMIDYDEPASNLYYQTVLDRRVNKLQQEYERAAEQGDVPEELQVALDHAKRDCRDALRFHRELYTAAEEIVQGLKHPTLVLLRQWFIKDGIVAFTIHSAYHWAKAHGKEVPEWAPPSITSATGDSEDPLTEGISQRCEAATQDRRPPATTALKNLRVTVHSMAHALGELLDQLVEAGHFQLDRDQACVGGDSSINTLPIAEFVASTLNLPTSDVNDSPVVDSYEDPQQVTDMTLALLTISFAELADRARAQEWVVFNSATGGTETRNFKKANGKYVSQRIYDYLALEQELHEDKSGQGERTVLKNLNRAKKLIGTGETPPISHDRLQQSIEEANVTFRNFEFA